MGPAGRIVIWFSICSCCYCGPSGVNNNPSNSVTAKSPSLNDVIKAISDANPGDTVYVPSGTATWSGQLEITKSILLIGAGIGKTIITSNYAAASDSNPADALIYYHQSSAANGPFKVSGFSWELANKCMLIYLENVTTTPLTKTRIDHNYIHNSNGRTIIINGPVYGVADNNTIDVPVLVLSAYGLNETSWTYMTFNFGTADNFYFEDNTVTTADTPHDGGAGGRYCARHNTYNWSNPSANFAPWFDMHGNGGTGGNLAGMGVEIYENIMSGGTRTGNIIDLRGGRGLIYNNTINTTSTSTGFDKVREEFLDSLNPPATATDGETQHVCNSYIWGNNQNGSVFYNTEVDAVLYYSNLGRNVPMADLDFWDQKASFDGSSGMGVGLKSAQPSSCTLEGAGYWATDEKRLYRWHSGAWQLYYTPYTYPHPLRGTL